MRDRIPQTTAIQVLQGDAGALPLPDNSADAAWLSLVLQHIPDLEAGAREIRRVVRPGGPVLIRQGFPDRYEPIGPLKRDGIDLVRWFPETFRAVASYPSLADTCSAFEAAGFREEALDQVPETYSAGLTDFLGQLDTFRRGDTTMRTLTDEEFLRGRRRLRRAVQRDEDAAEREPRTNWLDLLTLR